MQPRSRSRSLFWLGIVSLLLLVTGYAACVSEEEPDLEAFTLRDVLGLTPEWLGEQPAAERDRVGERVRGAITTQTEDGAWIELPADAAEVDRGPRRTLRDLDAALEALDRDPLLVQWSEQTSAGPVARACPLSEEDLTGGLEEDRGQWAGGWGVDEGFEVALGSRTERDALDALLPRLEQWIARCAGSAGPDAAPDGERTRMEIVRAESAPALVVWWPALREVHVNPLLLWLFKEKDELRVVSVRQALLPSDSLQACVDAVTDFCDRCGDVDATGVDGCGESLLNGATPAQSCRQLQTMTQGYAQFCVNHLLFNQQQLDICVAEQINAADCVLETPTRSLVSLDGRYVCFVQNASCVEVLNYCTSADQPQPDGGNPPPPPDDDLHDDEAECCRALGETGCYVCAESGIVDDLCSGFFDGACDDGCGDCEGDTGGGDCGGCEGDTY